MMKTAKDLSFIKRIALRPRTSPIETSFPLRCGGVWGREKANRPRATEAITPNT